MLKITPIIAYNRGGSQGVFENFSRFFSSFFFLAPTRARFAVSFF